MKRILTLILALALILSAATALSSCNTVDAEGLWEDATYRRDKTFGSGEKTIELEVRAGEDSVTFTVKTDKTTLADALLEHGLIDGEESDAYGFTVYYVNGMEANWTKDGSYWAMYKGGEYLMTGVSSTEISDGDHYEFVYTAG